MEEVLDWFLFIKSAKASSGKRQYELSFNSAEPTSALDYVVQIES